MSTLVTPEMSPKCVGFIEALEALCIKQGITLSSTGYGRLMVYDFDPALGGIWAPSVEDTTDGSTNTKQSIANQENDT